MKIHYCKLCADDGWLEVKDPRTGVVIGASDCICHKELLKMRERLVAKAKIITEYLSKFVRSEVPPEEEYARQKLSELWEFLGEKEKV